MATTQFGKWLVIENTPGYLPETEPAEFDSLADAQAYMDELIEELVEDGYVVKDRNPGYAYLARDERDLGRSISIELTETEARA